MNENTTIKRRIIIAVGAFIALIAVVSLIAFATSKQNVIPVEVSNLPKTATATKSTSTVYGIDALVNTTLSALQVRKFDQEFSNFVKTYTGEKLTYVTIEKTSVSITYNAADKSSEIRFMLTANSGTRYLVIGKYIYVNDMYILIYPESGNQPVYQQAYDKDDH